MRLYEIQVTVILAALFLALKSRVKRVIFKRQFDDIFSYFSQKIEFGIPCKLSP